MDGPDDPPNGLVEPVYGLAEQDQPESSKEEDKRGDAEAVGGDYVDPDPRGNHSK